MKKKIPGIKMFLDPEKTEKYATEIISKHGDNLRKYNHSASMSNYDVVNSINKSGKPIPKTKANVISGNMYGEDELVNYAIDIIKEAKKQRDSLIDEAIKDSRVPLLYRGNVKECIIKMLSLEREASKGRDEGNGERV